MGNIRCEQIMQMDTVGNHCVTNLGESPWVKEIEVPSAALGVEL
jgi:hypothetical protein